VKTSIATLKTHKEQQASRLAQQEALKRQFSPSCFGKRLLSSPSGERQSRADKQNV
jgi:hypothetical protein